MLLIYLNFHELKVVSRHRGTQLQVAENDSYLFNLFKLYKYFNHFKLSVVVQIYDVALQGLI